MVVMLCSLEVHVCSQVSADPNGVDRKRAVGRMAPSAAEECVAFDVYVLGDQAAGHLQIRCVACVGASDQQQRLDAVRDFEGRRSYHISQVSQLEDSVSLRA